MKYEHAQGFAETSTMTFEGRSVTAGGAYVDDARLICYPSKPDRDTEWIGPQWSDRRRAWVTWGYVTTCEGERMGRYYITGFAKGFPDITGRPTRLTCYRVILDDERNYVGRGLGEGYILRCRRAKGGAA